MYNLDEIEIDYYNRFYNSIDLIASNSIISKRVQKLSSSIFLNNIYSEGYINNRYYTGCAITDKIESLAIKYITTIFGYKYANVQAPSGSIANQIIYNSFAKIGDKILSLSLSDGGHLTHCKINNLSEKFDFIHYSLDIHGRIDYGNMLTQALQHKPKIIITGYSCYPYDIDHQIVKSICERINAKYFYDMSHVSDLIAGGKMKSPLGYADIIMSTTHKGIRGGKGAVILVQTEEQINIINKKLFPKTCGGQNTTSLLCNMLAFQDMMEPEHVETCSKIIENANLLITKLNEYKVETLYPDTENHIVIIDLFKHHDDHKILASLVVKNLEKIKIYTNKNITYKDVTFDKCSGIRLGVKSITYRGITKTGIDLIAITISNVIKDTIENKFDEEKYAATIRKILFNMLS